MAAFHAHVGAIFIEPDEFLGSLPQPRVIVAGDPHVGTQQRKAARTARQALGNDRQVGSLLGSNAHATRIALPAGRADRRKLGQLRAVPSAHGTSNIE